MSQQAQPNDGDQHGHGDNHKAEKNKSDSTPAAYIVLQIFHPGLLILPVFVHLLNVLAFVGCYFCLQF